MKKVSERGYGRESITLGPTTALFLWKKIDSYLEWLEQNGHLDHERHRNFIELHRKLKKKFKF